MPVDGEVVQPTLVVASPVGFDAEGFRPGHGGGLFDRTLAPMRAGARRAGRRGRPLGARVPSIFPQPHDVPTDVILTESSAFERPTPDGYGIRA